MQYFLTQTQREYNYAYRIECDMRLEQRYEQNLIVGTLESTPLGSEPPAPSMSQYRQNKLKQGAAEILRVLMNDDDFIPGI